MEVEAIIHINSINEDSRNYGSKFVATTGPGGVSDKQDWRVWTGQGYGQRVRNALYNAKGYSYEVSDFGKGVSIRASYHNSATGRGVEKTYIVLFDNPNDGGGTVFASSTKWRVVSNPEQAASYVSMSIKSYASSTSSI